MAPVDDLVEGVLLARVTGEGDKLGVEELAVLERDCDMNESGSGDFREEKLSC